MSVKDEIKKRIKHNQKHEQFLKECLEKLEAKESILNGEVAYLKQKNEIVPCLVVGIDLPNFNEVLNNRGEMVIRVQTKRGPVQANIDDLMEYSDKAKVLFSK